MIAHADLAALSLLATVSPDDLGRAAAGAADLHLAVGEYAVHEGDERALYLVLAGRIEVTKHFDGIERVIGKRVPGQIFGEVPLVFGIPFQGSFRAAEPSRVVRIDAAQFHTLPRGTGARGPDGSPRRGDDESQPRPVCGERPPAGG
jgi:thioredoxin reductase (NADPH)